MEGLSAAASIIAVVSVATQSLDAIHKIYCFWNSIQEAPTDVLTIKKDLELMIGVLEDFVECEKNYQNFFNTDLVIKSCESKVENLMIIVEDLDEGFKSTKSRIRKWSALKASFRSATIEKFCKSLESTKSTLLLAQQTYAIRSARFDSQLQLQKLIAIEERVSGEFPFHSGFEMIPPWHASDSVRNLRIDAGSMSSNIREAILRTEFETGFGNAVQEITGYARPSVSRRKKIQHSIDESCFDIHNRLHTTLKLKKDSTSWVSSPRFKLFGKLQCTSTTYKEVDKDNEGQEDSPTFDQTRIPSSATLEFHPPSWMQTIGMRYGFHMILSQSIRGWKYSLNVYRAVPDDSPIFAYCKSGDIYAIRVLLDAGRASLRDTDSQGWMPLHFAASNCNIELCKMLLNEGAESSPDTKPRYCSPYPPAALATLYGDADSTPAEDFCRRMDTIRLFINDFDFLPGDNNAWSTLSLLFYREGTAEPGSNSAVEWLLTLFKNEIRQNIAHTGHFSSALKYQNVKTVSALLDLCQDFISPCSFTRSFDNDNGYSALHDILARNVLTPPPYESLKLIIQRGAKSHAIASPFYLSNRFETPTSFALHRSHAFKVWKDVLEELNIDMKEFIREELVQPKSPLKILGWEQDTLLAMFNMEFEPKVVRCRDENGNLSGYEGGCSICFWERAPPSEPAWERRVEAIRCRRGETKEFIEQDEVELRYGYLCWDCRDLMKQGRIDDIEKKTGKQISREEDNDIEEDSPFLLSMEI